MAANSSGVLLASVVSLGTLVVACSSTSGGSGSPPVHPPFDAEGTNAILVGPGPQQLSIPNAFLRQDATHDDTATWVASDPDATLYIDFHDEIFEGMTPSGPGLYRVRCAGSRCDSGHLKKGVAHNKWFEYDQTVILPPGTKAKADGRIIIKP